MDYDEIKYEVSIDKIEQLNKKLLEQEIHINNYEKQKDIQEYNSYISNPTVINYLELLNLQNEISHKIGQLKKADKNNPNINLLINKARSLKEEINKLKEEDIVKRYLKMLNSIRVKYYLSELKELNIIKKQISIQENRMAELGKKVRNKILIKKD